MSELQAIGFTTTSILNWLIILAILLSGYFLYLKKIGKSNGKKEIEVFLDVLSFGVIAVGIIFIVTGIISMLSDHAFINDNFYFGSALHVTILFFAFLIVLHHFKIKMNRVLNICLIILVIAIFIYYLFFFNDVCKFYLIKMPFYPSSNLTSNQTAMDYCIYECYENYKINSNEFVSYYDANLSNIKGFHCICDIHLCKKLS